LFVWDEKMQRLEDTSTPVTVRHIQSFRPIF
jgi:hypothetical protein